MMIRAELEMMMFLENINDAQSLPDIINLYHFPPPAAADQVFLMADQFLIDPKNSSKFSFDPVLLYKGYSTQMVPR